MYIGNYITSRAITVTMYTVYSTSIDLPTKLLPMILNVGDCKLFSRFVLY